MDISIKTVEQVTVVDLAGDVDANTAPTVQEEGFTASPARSKILLDMLSYMSSAGLRMLLSLYRQASAKDGQLVLVGLSEEIQDTMSVTGFLDFYDSRNTGQD